MIRCHACGTENTDGASYCSKCARKLDDATQAAVIEQRTAHVTTGTRWSAVAIAIIIVLVIALVALLALHVIVI